MNMGFYLKPKYTLLPFEPDESVIGMRYFKIKVAYLYIEKSPGLQTTISIDLKTNLYDLYEGYKSSQIWANG